MKYLTLLIFLFYIYSVNCCCRKNRNSCHENTVVTNCHQSRCSSSSSSNAKKILAPILIGKALVGAKVAAVKAKILAPVLVGKAIIGAKLAAPAVVGGLLLKSRLGSSRSLAPCPTPCPTPCPVHNTVPCPTPCPTPCPIHVSTPCPTSTQSPCPSQSTSPCSKRRLIPRTPKTPISTRITNFLDSTANRLKVLSLVSRDVLSRSKRQARYNQDNNNSGKKMSLDEMLSFVKQNNAEQCLQKIICELSANARMYGDEGLKFGTSLMGFSKVKHPDAQSYKLAAKIGNQHRNRPSFCGKKYPKCHIDARQLIMVGNSIL